MVWEEILSRTDTLKFAKQDVLGGIVFRHLKDKNSKQLDATPTSYSFEVRKDIPEILQAFAGKEFVAREDIKMSEAAFIYSVSGKLEGMLEYRSFATYNATLTDTSTNLKLALQVNFGETVSSLHKEAVKAFMTAQVNEWFRTLPGFIKKYKS